MFSFDRSFSAVGVCCTELYSVIMYLGSDNVETYVQRYPANDLLLGEPARSRTKHLSNLPQPQGLRQFAKKQWGIAVKVELPTRPDASDWVSEPFHQGRFNPARPTLQPPLRSPPHYLNTPS